MSLDFQLSSLVSHFGRHPAPCAQPIPAALAARAAPGEGTSARISAHRDTASPLVLCFFFFLGSAPEEDILFASAASFFFFFLFVFFACFFPAASDAEARFSVDAEDR